MKVLKGKIFGILLTALFISVCISTQVHAEENNAPEVIVTVDGVDITSEHTSSGMLRLQDTGIVVTEENIEVIIEAFLKWADAKADTMNRKDFAIFVFYGNYQWERNDNLKMVITEEAAAALASLKQKGGSFTIQMGRENGGAIIYTAIEGATTLGYATREYLENEHWDFYGSGFDFTMFEFPYDEEGDVQLLYQAENGTMKIRDISDTEYMPEYNQINIYQPQHISYPGLHFLVPKDSVTAENMITLSQAATQEELQSILAPSATTLEGSIKATLGTTENQVVDASVFNQMVESKENVTGLTLEHNNITYEIATEDIEKTDVSMTVGATENTFQVQQTREDAEYAIDFSHSGDLPGNTKVTIPVTDIEDGNYYWSHLNDEGQLVETKEVTVSEKELQVTLTHCSTYVLTKEVPVNDDSNDDDGNDDGNNSGNGVEGEGNTGGGNSTDTVPENNSSMPADDAVLNKVPKTGDPFSVGALFTMTAVSGVSMITLKKKRKMKNE